MPNPFAHRPGARFWGFAGYLLAAFALTAPAWRNPGWTWPGVPGDAMQAMSWLGWYPFAIGHGLNPLLETYVNLPQGTNLMWNDSAPLLGVVMWPVTVLSGVVVSYNVAVVLAVTLGGWCTFLWLRRHVRHPFAAWLGGLFIVLGPFITTQMVGHLHLLLFFPIPLMLIVLERAVADPAHSSLRLGAALGVLGAAQILLMEETLALVVIVTATTLVIAALIHPHEVGTRWLPLLRTLGVSVVVFAVVAGGPLAYQFLGPGRITGTLQPPGFYDTDLVNLVVPNGRTAISPGFVTSLAANWTAGTVESDSYIGIPLILLTIWAAIRWWGERWLRLMVIGAAVALVWSLGPDLHVDGVTHHALPLPGRLFTALPVLENILPSRFALLMELGLAAVLAVFADRVLLQGGWRTRAAAAATLVLVAVSLAPQMPLMTWTALTPSYFLAGGDIGKLPAGTVALVVPYGDETGYSIEPLLWQAESGFQVKMVSGSMYTAGPGGAVWTGVEGTALSCALTAIQGQQPTTGCGSELMADARAELRSAGVSVIIMGPMGYGTQPQVQRTMQAFLTDLAGAAPRHDQGALVWSDPA